jgi:hypothetical protein
MNAGQRQPLRRADDLVHLTLPLTRRPDHEGSRDVGAVASDRRSKIQQQKVAGQDRFAARSGVRERRARASGDDRREWMRFAPCLAEVPFEDAAHRELREADAHAGDGPLERRRGNPACGANQRDFVGILADAQVFHEIAGRTPVEAVTLLEEALEVTMREMCRLEPRGLRPQLGQGLPHAGP